MTDRTPEQVVADNRLEDALADAARAYDVVPEDEIITTWLIAGASQGQEAGRTGYFHLYPAGTLPTHIAVGLLRMTEKMLLDDDAEEE